MKSVELFRFQRAAHKRHTVLTFKIKQCIQNHEQGFALVTIVTLGLDSTHDSTPRDVP